MTAGEQAEIARRGAGIFRLAQRGVLRVAGEDRVRWLDGMLSNDVASLQPDGEPSGCYATQLSRTGRILADFHVLCRPDEFWLETLRAAIPDIIAGLYKYVIADDVTLADVSADLDRIGVEGPAAPEILARAAGCVMDLRAESWTRARIGATALEIAAFGWSGAPAYQLFAPAGAADAMVAALAATADELGAEWVEAEPAALEILRIEAATPLLGAELDDGVLPDEAHLDHAISTTKGCYTGQEIVARLRSQGKVGHLLVSLAFDDSKPAPPGTELHSGSGGESRAVGEVTSSCVSPARGPIGIGFVRRAFAEPGTVLRAGTQSARVAPRPGVA